ncbi:hypothetical protein OAN22_02000, partial [Alphaproteobacteria bacterium]|nr:hypothetical protein [Alphaproteobacteria bacterium]
AGRTLDGILRELSESGVSAVGRSCANRFANNLGLIKGKGETNLLNYYLANLRNAESIINIISRESGTYTEGTKNQKRIDDAIEGVAKCLSEGTEKFAKKNERYAKIARIFEFATSRGNRMPQGGASTEPY